MLLDVKDTHGRLQAVSLGKHQSKQDQDRGQDVWSPVCASNKAWRKEGGRVCILMLRKALEKHLNSSAVS